MEEAWTKRYRHQQAGVHREDKSLQRQVLTPGFFLEKEPLLRGFFIIITSNKGVYDLDCGRTMDFYEW
ncbi:hypothetical protein [Thermoactinomyces mirandus]|uniref:Uncharacterized protein n=1 Tax=Thermoactinomyces mirandus TaxID=2756294 RepID=A0A7W2ASJ7_9BACL|nr:hypothetical protein [Thermoactinomyces mirandus]MBA4602735.1 hypothetical protein [Thermoactinomyces mirandus]